MATIRGNVTQNVSKYGCYINCWESNQSIENNSHLVTAQLHITRSSWGWQTSNSYSGSITIDGTNYSFSYSPNWPYASNGDVIVGTASKTVYHNSDGRKTCNVSANWNTSGTYSCGTASASGSFELTKIARASTVYCPDFNIGSSAIINISRADSKFTHTLEYTFGDLTDTIVEKTTETNIGWQAPIDFFEQIPSSKKGIGTITCKTYTGNTLLGTSTTNFTAFVVNSEPIVTVNVEDTREDVIDITGDKHKLVRYISNAEVTINAIAQNGASITNYSVKNGATTLTTQTSYFDGVEDGKFEIVVTDSRGFITTLTENVDIFEYIKPVITDVQADRTSSDSAEIIANLEGQWYSQNIVSKTNTLSGVFYFTEDGGETWSSARTLNLVASGNDFSFSGSLGLIFDPDKDVEIIFEISDGYSTLTLYSATYTIELPKGIPIIDIGEDDVNINGDLLLNKKSIKHVENVGKTIWLYASNAQTVAANTTVAVNYNAINVNTSNGALMLDGNSIKIGANVHTVLLEAKYRASVGTNVTLYIYVYKNDKNFTGSAYVSENCNSYGGHPHIVTAIPVEEGDTLTIGMRGTAGFTTYNVASWDYFKATVLG